MNNILKDITFRETTDIQLKEISHIKKRQKYNYNTKKEKNV